MVLIISGIHEIFFSLWLAVITVRHHQIPVYILGNDVLRDIECILTFSDILDNGSIVHPFPPTLPWQRYLYTLRQLLQFLSARPSPHTCFCSFCTTAGSSRERLPHRHSSLPQSLQFLLYALCLKLFLVYPFFQLNASYKNILFCITADTAVRTTICQIPSWLPGPRKNFRNRRLR